VSVIILVMAVGLSVDYSVHIMHSFLCVPGADRSLRAYEALRGAGRPVMMGAATTLAGVSLLAAGSSFIFLSASTLTLSSPSHSLGSLGDREGWSGGRARVSVLRPPRRVRISTV